MSGELTWLRIDTVASDGVLARVVVLLGSKSARVHDLCWEVEAPGLARITTLVEAPPGRTSSLAGAVSRIVDVLDVTVMRHAPPGRAVPPITIRKEHLRCASLSTT